MCQWFGVKYPILDYFPFSIAQYTIQYSHYLTPYQHYIVPILISIHVDIDPDAELELLDSILLQVVVCY